MAPSKFIAVLLALAAVSTAAAQAPPPPPPPATPAAPSSRNNGTSCDPLRLRVCGDLLRGLLPGGAGNGTTNGDQCCPLLGGLVGVDAAVCLCTALRANVLGIVNLNVPLGLRLLMLSQCGRGGVSASFTCAPA